jgi:Mg-chelatase subunit ChlD
MRVLFAAVLAVALAAVGVSAQGAIDHLEFLSAPQLVQCGYRPAFRVTLNPVDANRQLVPVSMTVDQAKKNFTINQDGGVIKPFYVRMIASDDGSGAKQENFVMLLLDTSGSMNRIVPGTQMTRFEAAKEAIRRSLRSLNEGADHVAVVPYDSHHVVERIKNATFDATRDGIERQLQAIPRPDTKLNNTALYTAMVEGLPVLRDRAGANAALLVILTDGVNEVGFPNDDPGLLGNEGLAVARARAAEARTPVTTVGFGLDNPLGRKALSELAWPNSDSYYDAATNPNRLQEVFEGTRRKLTNRIQMTFQPIQESKDQLAGKTVQFHVELKTGQSVAATRLEPTWNAPAMASPVYEANCSPAEEKALIDHLPGPTGPALPPIGPRLVILATLALVLAAFWFGAPRLVWPDAYVTRPTLPPMPSTPNVPGVQVSPFSPGSMRQPSPGATSYGTPAPRPETSVRLPPRNMARPGAPSRQPPRSPDTDAGRHASDETVYRPPDKRFKND